VTRIKNVKKRFYIYASMPRFIVIDWFWKEIYLLCHINACSYLCAIYAIAIITLPSENVNSL